MLWIDGRLHEGTHVPFDLSDRGLLLGDGVFDTAMALGGRIAFEEEHVGRLAAAAETLGFTIDRDRVVAGMRSLAARIPRAAIRTTVTRGTGPRGLAPPAAAAPVHWASAAPLMPGLAFATLSLMPVAIRRNETSPSARLKTLGYLDAVIGNREARAAGFDESLFLNLQGRVACAATGNLFLVEGERLLTPDLGEGVLPGVVRGLILSQIGPRLGIEVVEAPLTLSRFLTADAVFMTNSLRLVARATSIGLRNIPISNSNIPEQIAEAVAEVVAGSCSVPAETVA
ncbi:aminotransferase class IV [uncultured Methylobacterium sp.]|uniref:aminotransferase class IV n=1 Tax=uncultured Methylobacterium sp. TaxID=157278 RepID=UPI0035CC5074